MGQRGIDLLCNDNMIAQITIHSQPHRSIENSQLHKLICTVKNFRHSRRSAFTKNYELPGEGEEAEGGK
jgi:hypothetical protein